MMDTIKTGLLVLVVAVIAVAASHLHTIEKKVVILTNIIKEYEPPETNFLNVENYPMIMFDYFDNKVSDMRITGYISSGQKTALMEDFISGWTAAVSPNCIHLLGEKVYIRNHGIRYINDITASWLDNVYDTCTLDLAVPNIEEAIKIGNEIRTVVRLDRNAN